MNKELVLENIVEGYRNTISERYQYQKIKEKYEIPNSVTERTVNDLRQYFLDYVYPDFSQRAALNEAFDSLDDYTKNPQKLVGILKDAIKLVFRYGIHLPKILNAGLNAMNTFKSATNFENNLVNEAIKNDMVAPYDLEKIEALIKKLSRKDIEDFMKTSETLFEVLHDKALIKKIKEVIQFIIVVMKKKKGAYSANQIKGIEIGLEMITEGDKIFNTLLKKDQQKFVALILEIERDNLDSIF